MLIVIAQFFLDRFDLLAQIKFALHAFHFTLRLGLNFATEFQHLDLFLQQLGQPHELVVDAVHLQQLLGIFRRQAHTAGNQIGQLAGVIHIDRHDRQLFRHVRFQLDQFAEEILDSAHERFHLQIFLFGLGNDFDPCPQIGFFLDITDNPNAFQPLNDQAHGAIRCFQHTMNLGRCPNRVNLIRRRFFDIFIFASHQGDHAASR